MEKNTGSHPGQRPRLSGHELVTSLYLNRSYLVVCDRNLRSFSRSHRVFLFWLHITEPGVVLLFVVIGLVLHFVKW